MGGCAAPNCQNRTEKGFRVFRFPANKERRQLWLINCRRAKWTPTARSVLCEVHFEASQFEQHRLDNQRKLKPNAVPTIFDVPNPPKRLENTRVRCVARNGMMEANSKNGNYGIQEHKDQKVIKRKSTDESEIQSLKKVKISHRMLEDEQNSTGACMSHVVLTHDDHNNRENKGGFISDEVVLEKCPGFGTSKSPTLLSQPKSSFVDMVSKKLNLDISSVKTVSDCKPLEIQHSNMPTYKLIKPVTAPRYRRIEPKPSVDLDNSFQPVTLDSSRPIKPKPSVDFDNSSQAVTLDSSSKSHMETVTLDSSSKSHRETVTLDSSFDIEEEELDSLMKKQAVNHLQQNTLTPIVGGNRMTNDCILLEQDQSCNNIGLTNEKKGSVNTGISVKSDDDILHAKYGALYPFATVRTIENLPDTLDSGVVGTSEEKLDFQPIIENVCSTNAVDFEADSDEGEVQGMSRSVSDIYIGKGYPFTMFHFKCYVCQVSFNLEKDFIVHNRSPIHYKTLMAGRHHLNIDSEVSQSQMLSGVYRDLTSSLDNNCVFKTPPRQANRGFSRRKSRLKVGNSMPYRSNDPLVPLDYIPLNLLKRRIVIIGDLRVSEEKRKTISKSKRRNKNVQSDDKPPIIFFPYQVKVKQANSGPSRLVLMYLPHFDSATTSMMLNDCWNSPSKSWIGETINSVKNEIQIQFSNQQRHVYDEIDVKKVLAPVCSVPSNSMVDNMEGNRNSSEMRSTDQCFSKTPKKSDNDNNEEVFMQKLGLTSVKSLSQFHHQRKEQDLNSYVDSLLFKNYAVTGIYGSSSRQRSSMTQLPKDSYMACQKYLRTEPYKKKNYLSPKPKVNLVQSTSKKGHIIKSASVPKFDQKVMVSNSLIKKLIINPSPGLENSVKIRPSEFAQLKIPVMKLNKINDLWQHPQCRIKVIPDKTSAIQLTAPDKSSKIPTITKVPCEIPQTVTSPKIFGLTESPQNATTTNIFGLTESPQNATTTNIFGLTESPQNATTTNIFGLTESPQNATTTKIFGLAASPQNATTTNIFGLAASPQIAIPPIVLTPVVGPKCPKGSKDLDLVVSLQENAKLIFDLLKDIKNPNESENHLTADNDESQRSTNKTTNSQNASKKINISTNKMCKVIFDKFGNISPVKANKGKVSRVKASKLSYSEALRESLMITDDDTYDTDEESITETEDGSISSCYANLLNNYDEHGASDKDIEDDSERKKSPQKASQNTENDCLKEGKLRINKLLNALKGKPSPLKRKTNDWEKGANDANDHALGSHLKQYKKLSKPPIHKSKERKTSTSELYGASILKIRGNSLNKFIIKTSDVLKKADSSTNDLDSVSEKKNTLSSDAGECRSNDRILKMSLNVKSANKLPTPAISIPSSDHLVLGSTKLQSVAMKPNFFPKEFKIRKDLDSEMTQISNLALPKVVEITNNPRPPSNINRVEIVKVMPSETSSSSKRINCLDSTKGKLKGKITVMTSPHSRNSYNDSSVRPENVKDRIVLKTSSKKDCGESNSLKRRCSNDNVGRKNTVSLPKVVVLSNPNVYANFNRTAWKELENDDLAVNLGDTRNDDDDDCISDLIEHSVAPQFPGSDLDRWPENLSDSVPDEDYGKLIHDY